MKRIGVCAGMITILALTGCGGGSNVAVQKKTDAPPPIDLHVVKVEEYTHLGSKVPDGQYVVVTFHIKNNSNDTQFLPPANFVIENITDKKEDQYTQHSEPQMTGPFTQVYGSENRDKLLDSTPSTVHPRMEVERYIVYMLPADAPLDTYEIYYKDKTFELKTPLISSDTEVIDHRIEGG